MELTPEILYEDNHLLVVVKPPNLPVQADSSGDDDLLSILKRYVKEKYEKPGDAYLGLCHRLDRPVGGVMVFARTSKAASRLAEQFKGRGAKKRYAAVVEGNAPQSGALVSYLRETEGVKRVEALSSPAPGAKEAKLSFIKLAEQGGYSLLDIELLTGRKHQIRAQLAAAGYPIRSDQRYHPSPARGQIALWAYELSLEHPTRKERMRFFAPPRGEAFVPFSDQLAALPVREHCSVIYADARLLVAAKRAGGEVTMEDGGENSLQAYLTPIYGELYPVHRLDANTEGLLLFARDEAAQTALLAAFAQDRIEKYYQALLVGRLKEKSATLDAWAIKDAKNARLMVYDTPEKGAVPIKTGCRVLEQAADRTLVEIRLYTGRTHQIRAHMAHIGHPVLGDDKYGDREANKAAGLRRQALVSCRIVLHEPEGSELHYLDGREFRCPWGLKPSAASGGASEAEAQ
ncbi:MAG TPA: pseudouridine synthase [Feifaniaceae bacterium]|nr:pseudouridine synthase [Feifaniaceae bacterium]